jgi:hypothetical protein
MMILGSNLLVSVRRKRKIQDVTARSLLMEMDANVNPYLDELLDLKGTIPEWNHFFQQDGDDARGDNWVRLDVMGSALVEKYAWCCPDERALNILAKFAPLVEIGAGKGYWAGLLRKRGVDILPYERHWLPNRWTTMFIGGPEILKKDFVKHRNLFLCYPDEDRELAVACLNHFDGDYVIHVGELITTSTLSGGPQAPFGRTTSSNFQVDLMTDFHCILSAKLPGFPFSNDHVTVWKRTRWVEGRSGEDDDVWADIPADEQISHEVAAPCVRDLLKKS